MIACSRAWRADRLRRQGLGLDLDDLAVLVALGALSSGAARDLAGDHRLDPVLDVGGADRGDASAAEGGVGVRGVGVAVLGDGALGAGVGLLPGEELFGEDGQERRGVDVGVAGEFVVEVAEHLEGDGGPVLVDLAAEVLSALKVEEGT